METEMSFTATLATAAGTPVFDCGARDTFIDALHSATFADHIDYRTVTRVIVVDHSTGLAVFDGDRFAADTLYPAAGCEAPYVNNCGDLLAELYGI